MGKSKLWLKASAVFSSVLLVTVFIAHRTGTLRAYLFASPQVVEVAEARQEIKTGNLDGPKLIALEEDELVVSDGAFEDRPELVVASIIHQRSNASAPAGPNRNNVNQNVVISSSKSIVFDNSYFPSLPGIQSVVPATKLRTWISVEGLPPLQNPEHGVLFAEDESENFLGDQRLIRLTTRIPGQSIPMKNDWITGSAGDSLAAKRTGDPYEIPDVGSDKLAAVLDLSNQDGSGLQWNVIVARPRFAISGGTNAGSQRPRSETDNPQLQDFPSEPIPDKPSVSAKISVMSGSKSGIGFDIIAIDESTKKRPVMSGSKSIVLIPAPQYIQPDVVTPQEK